MSISISSRQQKDVSPLPIIHSTSRLLKGLRGLEAIACRLTMRFLSFVFITQYLARIILKTLPIYPGLGPAWKWAGLLPPWLGYAK